MQIRWKEFVHWVLFPKFGKAYLIRITVVALTAFLFFKFICKPMILNGDSMKPNYRSGTLNFCWTPTYLFRKVRCGDVVVLRYAGERVMLLKRVVALSGDTLEFREGILYRNGEKQTEEYVILPREKWNLPPRKVPAGYLYVVGDNRSMPMWEHKFGIIRAKRVQGSLLF